jgi:DNA-binding NarL/FixJ family response regulator
MGPEKAQQINTSANIDEYRCHARGSGGDTDLLNALDERGGSGSVGGSGGDVWRHSGANGQRDGRDYRVDPRGRHEFPGWETLSTDTRRSPLDWSLPDGLNPLRDARILIVDDCTLDRENLAATFVVNGTAVPSVAWNLPSLVAALEGPAPSVILISIGTRDNLMLLQAALRMSPQARVIVLGVSEEDESDIVACAEAGVAGYHMRTESLDDLLELIRRVAAGESVCSPRVSAILLKRLSVLAAQRQPPPTKELVLTARETQILRMLEMGLSNRDIAARLCIAVHTVKNHVHSLLRKLGVSTRAEAAALGRTLRHADSDHRN